MANGILRRGTFWLRARTRATERVLADFAAVGLVAEQANKLEGYLAAVSRKLDKPLGVVIQ